MRGVEGESEGGFEGAGVGRGGSEEAGGTERGRKEGEEAVEGVFGRSVNGEEGSGGRHNSESRDVVAVGRCRIERRRPLDGLYRPNRHFRLRFDVLRQSDLQFCDGSEEGSVFGFLLRR